MICVENSAIQKDMQSRKDIVTLSSIHWNKEFINAKNTFNLISVLSIGYRIITVKNQTFVRTQRVSDQSNSDSNENDYMNTGMLSKNYSETKKLLLKVTITVGIKIITTILITVIFNNVTAIKTVLNEHPWISPVFGIQALLFGGLLFFVPNSLTSKPWNYILLSLIALTSGIVISTFAILPSTTWSMLSWIIANMLFGVFFIAGLKLKFDLTRYWHLIIIYALIMMCLGFIISVLLNELKTGQVANHILGAIYVLISIPCIICEGQMMQGGKCIVFKRKQFVLASLMCWFTLICTYFGVLFQLSDYNFFVSYISNT
uniref:Transmembrane protein n=1 Tax=Trichobilharzia regenti TaxID=157069 RepID=A0AA85IVY1_TRIRE|nr:unnamed protein product [Trichobilharzia regenti]